MKQSVNNDIRYVRYVVSLYLRDKPELQNMREDLEQEGMLGLLKGRDDYDSSKGYDRALWLHYMIQNALKNYINRVEVRHFRTPKAPVEEDREVEEYDADKVEHSQYWDLADPVELEAICDDGWIPQEADRLHHFTERITMTDRSQEILDEYLRCGDMSETARIIGTSKQYVRKVINKIIKDCKEL